MADPELTAGDFEQTVQSLSPELRDLVLSGARQQAAERIGSSEVQERQATLKDMVEGWVRTSGSDSDIESVYSYLQRDCFHFLHLMEGIEEPNKLERLGVTAAAITYAYLVAEDDEFDDDDLALFGAVGVDQAKLLDVFKQGIIGAWGLEDESDEAAEVRSMRTIDDLPDQLEFQPEQWRLIVNPQFETLRTACVTAGIELRQLNRRGLYDDEED